MLGPQDDISSDDNVDRGELLEQSLHAIDIAPYESSHLYILRLKELLIPMEESHDDVIPVSDTGSLAEVGGNKSSQSTACSQLEDGAMRQRGAEAMHEVAQEEGGWPNDLPGEIMSGTAHIRAEQRLSKLTEGKGLWGVVLTDEETLQRVLLHGGPLTFLPPTVSAEIKCPSSFYQLTL